MPRLRSALLEGPQVPVAIMSLGGQAQAPALWWELQPLLLPRPSAPRAEKVSAHPSLFLLVGSSLPGCGRGNSRGTCLTLCHSQESSQWQRPWELLCQLPWDQLFVSNSSLLFIHEHEF